MPQFDFEAIDASGQPLTGQLDADDVQAATDRLQARGYTKVRILGSPRTTDAPKPQEALSVAEFGEISTHVANLTEAGLPLSGGLRAVAEELPHSRLQRSLVSIADQLDAGVDLSVVLERHGAPPNLVALIRTGMRVGNTEVIVQQFAAQAQASRTLRQRLLVTLSYPLLVMMITIAGFGLVLSTVVRQFRAIFEGFGVELPGITILLISLSDLLMNDGLLLLTVVSVGSLVLWCLLRITTDAATRRRCLYRIPLLGPLFRYSAWSRFYSLLSLFTGNSMPLPEALLLSAEGVSDPEMQRTGRLLARELRDGALPSSATSKDRFPAQFVYILGRQNDGSTLSEALRLLSNTCDHQARLQIALVTQFTGLSAVVVIVLTLAFTVLALFMPLIKLLNDLS